MRALLATVLILSSVPAVCMISNVEEPNSKKTNKEKRLLELTQKTIESQKYFSNLNGAVVQDKTMYFYYSKIVILNNVAIGQDMQLLATVNEKTLKQIQNYVSKDAQWLIQELLKVKPKNYKITAKNFLEKLNGKNNVAQLKSESGEEEKKINE